MTNEQLTQQTNSYLTITALADGTTITFTASSSNIVKTISVSTDNGSTWTQYTSSTSGTTIATLNTNDKLLIKGTNSTYASSTSLYNRITSNNNVNLSGNIMSLIYGDNFSTQTTLSASYTFTRIFYGLNVVDALYLVLPATKLTYNCYRTMFFRCTSLVNAPALLATTLASDCYYGMFQNCTSLTEAPQLPATNLAEGCYSQMFGNCTSLVNAPALPATTLVSSCYQNMFYGCTSLTKAPVLPATTLTNNCYDSMFKGCKSLTKAPELPATTLVNGCYNNMFNSCSNLNYIKALFTTTPSTTYTQDWVKGVSNRGLFIKNSYVEWHVTGDNGIPTNWDWDYTKTIYFAITAIYDNTSIKFYTSTDNSSSQKTIDVSADSFLWTSYTSSTSGTVIGTLSAGETIFIKGTNNTYASSTYYNYFSSDKDFKVFGSIMSLIYGNNYGGQTTLSDSYTFRNLFLNSRVVDASSLSLPATTLSQNCYDSMFKDALLLTAAPELPATTLALGCYKNMFDNCASLVTAPELPATTLAAMCYNSMFFRCASLYNAPALPATTLASDCYNSMFRACALLHTAPALPATTLASGCYNQMFHGCTNLTTAPALPATTLTDYCYSNMFAYCASLTTAPALPATTLTDYCYSSMFYDCISLVRAPELPATTLVNGCYNSMFNGCSNLNYIKASFTTTPSNTYTENWVNGVSSTGTFLKSLDAEWDVIGTNGVPTGWTIFDSKTSYFTISSLYDNVTVSFYASSDSRITKTISVSTDNGSTWTEYTSSENGTTIATLNKDEMILIKGSNSAYAYENGYTYFRSSSHVNIIGNIMSLIYGDNFIGQTTLSSTYTFYRIFYGLRVVDASHLILPATTLTDYCYSYMFESCASLTKAPKLPATTLVSRCYRFMFANCLSLTTAPALPATNLASECYAHMFYGCANLTTPPELPATTLVDYCYAGMFENCTSLTTSPKLYATTLVNGCYNAMFEGCTSLNDITALFTTTPYNSNYTYEWVSGVASIGNFKKNRKATWDDIGTYAVPVGWTISYISIDYLAITALEDNTTISFKASDSSVAKTISVSTNNCLTWTEYTSSEDGTTIATLNTNDTILIKGSNSTYNENNFVSDKTVNISGNIMSLIYGDNYDGQTTLTEPYCFSSLFGLLQIVDASNLILPAITLTENCYSGMFAGCSTLTKAPQLPATLLKSSCYYLMFANCTSLTAAPELPATRLAESCYSYMFYGCTSLTTAPALPATTLTTYCYYGMFQSCTSLTTAPVLPAKYVPNNAYWRMFFYCDSLNYIEMYCISFEQSISTFAQYYANVPTEGTFVADPTATWVNEYTVPQYWNIKRKHVNIGDCNIFYVDSNSNVINVSALYLGSIPVQMTS